MADVVPGAHAHAAIDRHRDLRSARQHDTQATLRQHRRQVQRLDDRHEVVAVRAQSVQHQQAEAGRLARLQFDGFEVHGREC